MGEDRKREVKIEHMQRQKKGVARRGEWRRTRKEIREGGEECECE